MPPARASLARLLPDSFTLALVGTVLLASLLPARGLFARGLDVATDLGVGLLFFLHGAKLSREAIVAGATHLRLHGLILAATFVLFPLLGLAIKPLADMVLSPELYLGVLFLCVLPSTVQSSIAFTSMAGGNVSAAVCAASLSNLLGVFITPLLVGILLTETGALGSPASAIGSIVVTLLVPFVAGHLLRPWLGVWIERRRSLLRFTDQGTILLIVYTAFSASVVDGLWRTTAPAELAGTLLIAALLLATAMTLITLAARWLRLPREDEIAMIFCGSKKTMASGIPMAKILFASHPGGIGTLVLPIMVFHQIQLMVCAVIARRYATGAPHIRAAGELGGELGDRRRG